MPNAAENRHAVGAAAGILAEWPAAAPRRHRPQSWPSKAMTWAYPILLACLRIDGDNYSLMAVMFRAQLRHDLNARPRLLGEKLVYEALRSCAPTSWRTGKPIPDG